MKDDEEVTALIERLTEEGTNLEGIMQEIGRQFPEAGYEMSDVYSCCTEYLRRRLGVTRLNKPEVRLKVYQMFDKGKSLTEVCSLTGLPMHSIYKYHSEWYDLYGDNLAEQKAESREGHGKRGFSIPGRFSIPGGAVFGQNTRRDMIWRGADQ